MFFDSSEWEELRPIFSSRPEAKPKNSLGLLDGAIGLNICVPPEIFIRDLVDDSRS